MTSFHAQIGTRKSSQCESKCEGFIFSTKIIYGNKIPFLSNY